MAWGNEVSQRLPGQICIDGKSLKRALDERRALHLVSAFCTENQIVLGSVDAGSKGKEIAAIKQLLGSLVLKQGDTVTIDAIGCQKSVVNDIRKQEADYMIALKKNQGKLFDEAENFFNQAIASEEYATCSVHRNQEHTRGRKEKYEVWVTEELDWLDLRNDWKDLNQLILVKRTKEEKGLISVEKHYYIASGKNSAKKIGELARGHWTIENKYHWHLDVTFKEDASQIGASNKNLKIARNIALQILKAKPIKGMSYRRQMKKCSRSDNHLRELLLIGNF